MSRGPSAADEAAAPYSGTRVLVVGGLGFIGSGVARTLAAAGARVAILDALVPTHGGSRSNIAGIEERVDVTVGDLRDRLLVARLVRGQDVIVNCAGQTSHADSMREPLADLEMNCRGQLSLLEACRANNPEAKVVHAGTRQVYGRPRYLPVDELHPVAPVDVNGIHKAAAEGYHLLYARVYGLRVALLRLTNTYGPGMRVRDGRQMFLGSWFRSVLAGEDIEVYGDGLQRRDLSYVDDAVAALLLAGGSEAADGQVFNIGDDRSTTLIDLARMVVETHGSGSLRLVPFPPERVSIDIGDYVADWSLIHARLGWRPTVPLEDGIPRTLAFYRGRGREYWAA